MKLHNRCGNGLSHILQVKEGEKVKNVTYFIANGDFGEVPEEVAKIWLNIPGVSEYVEPEDLKKAEAEAKEKQAALEKENEELKKQIQELKDAAAKAEAEAKEKQAALEKENEELKKQIQELKDAAAKAEAEAKEAEKKAKSSK